MSDWTAPDFFDKLETAVAARAGITGLTPKVRVITYFPSIDEALSDTLILGYEATDSNEPAALGQGAYDETVDVECQIRIVRPGAGSTVARTARVRASNLLGEIDNELRTNLAALQVGRQTISALITDRQMSQFPYQAGTTGVRVCTIDFTIRYAARTNRES